MVLFTWGFIFEGSNSYSCSDLGQWGVKCLKCFGFRSFRSPFKGLIDRFFEWYSARVITRIFSIRFIK